MRKMMRKAERVSMPIGFIFLILAMIMLLSSKISEKTMAYAFFEESENCCFESIDYAYICYDGKSINKEEERIITVEAKIKHGYIQNITYSATGFEVLDSQIIDDTHAKLKIHHIGETIQCDICVKIGVSSGKNLECYLYGINTESGLFLSKYSEDDALEKYLCFATGENIISEDRAEVLRGNYYRTGMIDLSPSNYNESEEHADATEKVFRQEVRSEDTYIHGLLQWEDENNLPHPLKWTKVEVCDSDINNSYDLLATTYTDSNGNYSASFTNLEILELNGRDLFIRVYAGDGDVFVYKNNETTKYIWESDREGHQNVATGSDTAINKTFAMDNEIGKAMQISQAIIMAKAFYEVMSDVTTFATTLKVVYPADYTYYKKTNETIYIISTTNTIHNYSDWDVIMHEYGHYVISLQTLNIWGQDAYSSLDMDEGWHKMDVNLVDHYMLASSLDCDNHCPKHGIPQKFHLNYDCKRYGLEAAWVEALSTIYGALCQEYYANSLTNIPGIADNCYSDSFKNYSGTMNYKTSQIYFGDGCEMSIATVLWNMFDKNASNNGNLPYGYTNYYNLLFETRFSNFAAFIRDLISNHQQYAQFLGDYLTTYGMASTITGSYSSVILYDGMSPITLTWNEPSGNQSIPNTAGSTINFFSEDYSRVYYYHCNGTSTQLSTQVFLNTSDFNGEILHVVIRNGDADQLNNGFVSSVVNIKKRVFIYSGTTITDTYCDDLYNHLDIPSAIDGITITAIGNDVFSNMSLVSVSFPSSSAVTTIGNNAFRNCTELISIRLPDSLESIGQYAFYGDSQLLGATYEGTTLEIIDSYAFYGTNLSVTNPIAASVIKIKMHAFEQTSLPEKFYIPENSQLYYIGSYAFSGITTKKTMVLPQTITTIYGNAFSGCTNLTLYAEVASKPSGWNSSWNSSNRPVFWGCTLSSDKSYVASFTKSASNPTNTNAANGIINPTRKNYTFGGWYTTSDYSGTQYMDVTTAPNGTLYAKWNSSSCVTEGSLITLADGSQVSVESLTGNENLLVWNMLTGQYDTAPILFIDSDPYQAYEVITLTFSDNTQVKVISEHAFFDMTIGEYVFLRNDAAQYIGHYFNKKYGNTWTTVQLTNVSVGTEYTTAWSPVTYGHLCYYVNGMLSMPGATEGFINIFDVDTTLMQYEAEQMAEDIQMYGLYTYEEFNAIIPLPELVFNAFNGQYLKVSIGKELITLNEIAALLERYAIFFN